MQCLANVTSMTDICQSSDTLSLPVGDDRLDAGDLRTGLRLLANGTQADVTEVAAIEQERRWEGVPPMFEETTAVADERSSGRRKSVRAEMLTAHETSQVGCRSALIQ